MICDSEVIFNDNFLKNFMLFYWNCWEHPAGSRGRVYLFYFYFFKTRHCSLGGILFSQLNEVAMISFTHHASFKLLIVKLQLLESIFFISLYICLNFSVLEKRKGTICSTSSLIFLLLPWLRKDTSEVTGAIKWDFYLPWRGRTSSIYSNDCTAVMLDCLHP